MTAPTVIPTETASNDYSADDAQDVAETLIALGWPVEPVGDDMAFWLIGKMVLNDRELIGFATRQGVWPAAERTQ